MKIFQHVSVKKFPFTAVAGAACLFMAGCSTNGSDSAYYTYGEPYYYTSDVYAMGTVYDPYYYYFKNSASGTTSPGEQITEPLTFHSECGCFVRRSTYTGDAGFERDRTDSVIFLDAAGAPILDTLAGPKTTKILHKRHVVNSAGSREADILIDVTVDIVTDSAVKKGIWNGSISGSFNGQDITAGSVESVTRPWKDSTFGYPESGTLAVDHPEVDLKIEFQADSTAKVTISDTQNDRTYIQTVDENFIETEPILEP